MVVESVSNLKLASEVFEYQLLELSFSEHMVVSVVNLRLLLCVLHTCLDECAVLRSGLFPFFFGLLISVMQMPRDKDVLSGELSVLLLIRPYVDEHCTLWLQDSMHLGPHVRQAGHE